MPSPPGRIVVRRALPKDAVAYTRMMGDPAVFAGLMQMPYPSEDVWRARLSESSDPNRADLPLAAELDGEVVGSAGMMPASPALRRRHAMMIGISVVPEAQGQGVGHALMAAMCDYADRWMGVLRLELTVYADNEVAIRLYRRFGFEIEGRFRGYAMRDGKLTDALSMARFHPDPPRIEAPAAE